MKVLSRLTNPTFFSNLSRSYPAQSLAYNGFYGAYKSYPPSTIIRNPNQIFSNSFAQYNPPPSINYSNSPIATNSIPANYYSYPPLPIIYSAQNLSYVSHHNPISSISHSSLPTGITYSSATYQSLNPHLIPSNFYASQSSNLSHNFVSSNLSNFNVSSYRSNQVAVDSNLPIEFTDNFFMPIKNAHGFSDNINLKQIASLVPNGFTVGILEPEIDSNNNKLKICNSVSLSEVPSKIWIRNGDNLVELPNHLLEKNSQISEQNLYSSPMITPRTITSETSFLDQHNMPYLSFDRLPFPTIMKALKKSNESIIRIDKITTLEKEVLGRATCESDLPTRVNEDNILTISSSTMPVSSPLSLSTSNSTPSSTINRQLEIMTPEQKMVNGDLEGYGLGSEFIVRFTEQPNSTGRAIIC